MVYIYQTVFVISFARCIVKSHESGICSSSSLGNPLECCQNYRAVGNSCVECWPGTHGLNCNKTCPLGFYGRFCAETCTCYPCDNVKGCTNITSNNSSTPQDIDGEIKSLPAFVITTSVSLSICFTLCLALFCFFRLCRTARISNQTDRQRYVEAHFSNEREDPLNLQAQKDLYDEIDIQKISTQ